jgi:carbamoyl-phosphate synthase large subunit
MRIVLNDDELEQAVLKLLKHMPNNKILIDHFLDRAEEAEIDAIVMGEQVHIMGVMEHIEPAVFIPVIRVQYCPVQSYL